MLRFAQSCVGKPFSSTAMARSVIWPRKTDGRSFFCAELVAAVLKAGNLIDPISNPGAATPEALHELYKSRATTTANPYLLRQANCHRNLTTHSVVQERHYTPPPLHQSRVAESAASAASVASVAAREAMATTTPWSSHGRQSALRVLNEGTAFSTPSRSEQLGLTLNSLNFRSR